METARKYASVVAAVLALGLAGCGASGGEDEAVSTTKTSDSELTSTTRSKPPTTTTTAEPTTTTTPKLPQLGESSQSGGIVATLHKVTEASSIKVNQSGFRTGSGYETITDLPAGDGAKFIVVEATIKNESQASIDLTCGYPVRNLVVDVDKREYDSIESLYEIPGNPGCNDGLQPGFDAKITYVYRLPADVEPLAWYVEDVTELGSNEVGTAFEITV